MAKTKRPSESASAIPYEVIGPADETELLGCQDEAETELICPDG